MKTILILLAVIMIGCSSDDVKPTVIIPPVASTPDAEVLSYDLEIRSTTGSGYLHRATAVVKNLKSNPIYGKVQFKMTQGAVTNYITIDNVDLIANQTATFEGDSNIYLDANPNITEVVFITD